MKIEIVGMPDFVAVASTKENKMIICCQAHYASEPQHTSYRISNDVPKPYKCYRCEEKKILLDIRSILAMKYANANTPIEKEIIDGLIYQLIGSKK